MRLIDADALLSKMEKYSDDNAREKNEYLFGMQQRLETCIELVEDAPTVDAVPVKHGRWITYELQINGYAHATCECTVCGAFRPHTLFPMKYCSNCGARMDWKDGDT